MTSGREVVVTFVEGVVLMRWQLTRRANSADPVFGHKLDKKLVCAFSHSRVDARDDFCQMHDFSGFFSAAELAVEVPKIHAGGQGHAPLAFDVLADFVFVGVQHAVRVFTFDLKFERFSHGRLYFGWVAV